MNIFFDVDGVLIDGFHAKAERRNRWDRTLEKDLGIAPEKFQEIFSGWFLKVIVGQLDFEEELDRWLKFHDYDLKAWQVIQYWHEKDSVLNGPVWNIVQALSGKPGINLYVATNQTHARAQYLWDQLRFKNHFKKIYYSARLGYLKFDPLYFQNIEDELGLDVKADPPLYFDDDVRNIEIAAARGWNAVLVDGPEDVTEHPAVLSLIGKV